ncbi:hypothetical protein NPIL_364091, partial [Nephila pilipes]
QHRSGIDKIEGERFPAFLKRKRTKEEWMLGTVTGEATKTNYMVVKRKSFTEEYGVPETSKYLVFYGPK